MAGVLGSGRTLVNVSSAAALIAGVGLFHAGSGPTALALCSSLICWTAGVGLGARVRVDEGLFHALAEHPESESDLDALLVEWKLIGNPRRCSLRDRCRGAMRLWRMQVVFLLAQIVCLAVAGATHFAGL